jgi:hypothetical protein
MTSLTGFSEGKTAVFTLVHRKKRPKLAFARERRW